MTINTTMTMYSIVADHQSQQTPVLKKGPITISSTVNVYFMIGSDAVANREKCAIIRAGESRRINLPTRCLRLAVLAVNEPGVVSVTEESEGVRARCSI